jgi:hypothetical protein
MNQLKCEHSFPVCIHCEERHKREVSRLQEQYENRTPTEWAYEQACKALEIWHGEANRLKDELAKAEKVVEAARHFCNEVECDGFHHQLWIVNALHEFDKEPL